MSKSVTPEPTNRTRPLMRTIGASGLLALVAALAMPTAGADGGAAACQTPAAAPAALELPAEVGESIPVGLLDVRGLVNAADLGLDGSGVDVALIDTGVATVDGLDAPGKVLHGPDLSPEGQDPTLATVDTYGHGTHMAGIIVGDRDGAAGIAPGARLISVKAAGADGETSVGQIIAALDWVILFGRQDGLNVRVVNIAAGFPEISQHEGDALSAAVERAWDAGIFVVAAAGNRGETQGHLDSPAIDPFVMAVAAEDTHLGAPASFSAQGDGVRNPDLMAPGRSIASYRVADSTIDTETPSARVGDDLFLGSGTSQAAAVTSGVAALLLEADPTLTPDELKAALMLSADESDGHGADKAGAGRLDAAAAVGQLDVMVDAQMHEMAGRCELTEDISGNYDSDWNGATWQGATWQGATWQGATWQGSTWQGAAWQGSTWQGAAWQGSTWQGAAWQGSTWQGAAWQGSTWQGAAWQGATWA